MYINSAYINDSLLYCKDDKHPLSIGSCGNYKLLTDTILPTTRPHGRPDYQLIYIASGIAHFFSEHYSEDISIDNYASSKRKPQLLIKTRNCGLYLSFYNTKSKITR